jgi:putative transposase
MSEREVRYRYGLRVRPVDAVALGEVFDACRKVWNQALGRWKELWREERLGYSYGEMAAELTDWRAAWGWLAAQPQCPQQQTLRRLHRSIRAFFDKDNPAGRPRFKSSKRGEGQSAEWTRNGFAVSGSGLGSRQSDRLAVAVGGGRLLLRVAWSRPLPSPPSSVTVYRDRAGRWWASFVCKVRTPDGPVNPIGRTTGLDLGLETFAITEHPATDVKNPRFGKAEAAKLRRLNRHLARTQKASNNRRKLRCRKARLEATVADRRREFYHHEARKLVQAYDQIGVEDLAVINMTRKAKGGRKRALNRSINDAGWAAFRRILVWQATKAGKQVVVLPARDTTQRCSCCGTKAKPRIELSDRVFRCRCCGLVSGRDRNAARNLHPGRPAPGGGTEPSGGVSEGDDDNKTLVPAGAGAV